MLWNVKKQSLFIFFWKRRDVFLVCVKKIFSFWKSFFVSQLRSPDNSKELKQLQKVLHNGLKDSVTFVTGSK